jgi:hypothetical protein
MHYIILTMDEKKGSSGHQNISFKIGKHQELNKRIRIKLQNFYCCELGQKNGPSRFQSIRRSHAHKVSSDAKMRQYLT